jgi:hypothetical protein
MSNPYGGLAAVNAVQQNFSATPTKFTGWTAEQPSSGGDASVQNDLANKRVLVEAPGTYKVTFSGSFLSNALGATLSFQLYKGGAAVPGVQGDSQVGATVASGPSGPGGPDVRTVSFSGLVNVGGADAGQVTGQAANEMPLEVYGFSNTGATNCPVTFQHAAFTVERVA